MSKITKFPYKNPTSDKPPADAPGMTTPQRTVHKNQRGLGVKVYKTRANIANVNLKKTVGVTEGVDSSSKGSILSKRHLQMIAQSLQEAAMAKRSINKEIHPVNWLINHPKVDLDHLEMETGSDPVLMRKHYKSLGIHKEFKKQFSNHDFDNAAFHAFVSRDPSEYKNVDAHKAVSRLWWKKQERPLH